MRSISDDATRNIVQFLLDCARKEPELLSREQKSLIRVWERRKVDTNPQLGSVSEIATVFGYEIALMSRKEVRDDQEN